MNAELYKIDLPDGRSYIGVTTQGIKKRMGNHKANIYRRDYPLYLAMRNFNFDDCHVSVLETGSHEQMLKAEKLAIVKFNTRYPNGLNMELGGVKKTGEVHDETLKKLAVKSLGKKHSEESKEKMAKARLGTKASEETKAKLSAMRIGNTHSIGFKVKDETKLKISKSLKGRIFSDEHKAKIGAALTGKKKSPEAIAKMAASLKGHKYNVGRVCSQETKDKISATKRMKSKEVNL